jgi:hypothetical protein
MATKNLARRSSREAGTRTPSSDRSWEGCGGGKLLPLASVALAADRTAYRAYRLSFGGADIHVACGMRAGQSLGGVAL